MSQIETRLSDRIIFESVNWFREISRNHKPEFGLRFTVILFAADSQGKPAREHGE